MSIVDKAYRDGYEYEYERELLGRDGKPVGVTVWLKAADCNAAVAVDDKFNRDVAEIQTKNFGKDIPDGAYGDLLVNKARDEYIACISRWDFKGEELFEGEGEPDCGDYETKLKFYKIPLFGKQVRDWVDDISAFTKT